ncbi:hypothetical protein [Thermogymnomonas acidicola]|uniref:hypothetical protein n=1 Tax=Thermogymnomonas acidicola TaxID=399579 RepID=UPI0009464C9A|nr:hypothetical protein [Thermogymnomonas acidicola]
MGKRPEGDRNDSVPPRVARLSASLAASPSPVFEPRERKSPVFPREWASEKRTMAVRTNASGSCPC